MTARPPDSPPPLPADPAVTEAMQRYLDGDATAEQTALLDAALAADPHLRRTFRRLAAVAEGLSRIEPTSGDAAPPVAPSPVRSDPARPAWRRAAGVALGLAVCAAAAALLWPGGPAAEPAVAAVPAAPPVAVVTDAAGGGIVADGRSHAVGAGLPLGVWAFPAGRTEVQLDSGVELALEGPGAFELLRPDHGRLTLGKAVARVPEEAVGFRIETRSVDVTDLGTEFAVNAAATGASAVHVFDGEVETVPLRDDRPAGALRRLTENETLRVGPDGTPAADGAGGPDAAEPFAARLAPADAAGGRVRTTGRVRRLSRAPRSTRIGKFQHDYLLLFRERSGVTLPADLAVLPAAPGRVSGAGGLPDPVVLPAGTRVDSYLIHLDVQGPEHTFVSGTVTFPEPLVGLIVTGPELCGTDRALGAPGTKYPNAVRRRFETDRGGGDQLTVNADGRRLALSLRVGAVADQIRVLTAAPPAEPAAEPEPVADPAPADPAAPTAASAAAPSAAQEPR